MLKNKKKILIFGAYGNLGDIISRNLLKKFKILRVSRKKKSSVYIKNFLDIPKIINEKNPDIIINLIAETNLDYCEKNKIKAKEANINAVKKILEGIKLNKKKIRLIHFSTDGVYSQKKFNANREFDAKPINYYSKTKLLGEKIALKCNSIVIRTNFLGKQSKTKRLSLTDWIDTCIKKKKIMYGYKNIYFNPLHTSTLCQILIKIINKSKIKGIFNLGSAGYISKNDLIKIFLKRSNNLKLLRPINYIKKDTIAPRPLNMIMNCKKIEKQLSIKLPSIKKEIYKTLKEYF